MPATGADLESDQIDVAALRALVDAGEPPRLLDVRSPQEFQTVHIPGSWNVPLDALREHVDEFGKHLQSTDVIVCRSGQRAREAQRLLAANGARAGLVLDGGIAAWQQCQAPVKQGRSVWGLERQVRLVVGVLVLLSIITSVFLRPAKWLAAVVGSGLTFAAVTQTCMLERLLLRFKFNRSEPSDARSVMTRFTQEP